MHRLFIIFCFTFIWLSSYSKNIIRLTFKVIFNDTIGNTQIYSENTPIKINYKNNQIGKVLLNKNIDVFHIYFSDTLNKKDIQIIIANLLNQKTDSLFLSNICNYYDYYNYGYLLTNYRTIKTIEFDKQYKKDSLSLLKKQNNKYKRQILKKDTLDFYFYKNIILKISLKINLKDTTPKNNTVNYKEYIKSNILDRYNYSLFYYPTDLLRNIRYFNTKGCIIDSIFILNFNYILKYDSIGKIEINKITQQKEELIIATTTIKELLINNNVNFNNGEIKLLEYQTINQTDYIKYCKTIKILKLKKQVRSRKIFMSSYGVCIDCYRDIF